MILYSIRNIPSLIGKQMKASVVIGALCPLHCNPSADRPPARLPPSTECFRVGNDLYESAWLLKV